jgi:hypothetical protein
MDRRVALKVKIKSLTAEARIISQMSAKFRSKIKGLRGWIAKVENKEGEMDGLIKERQGWIADLETQWCSITCHRDSDIAEESRASLLAYSCIRDRTRGERTQKPISTKKVEAMLVRFGGLDPEPAKKRLADWLAKTEHTESVSR